MTTKRDFLLRSLCGGCLVLVLGLAAPALRGAEWTPLFNGKDLTGWKAVHDAQFEVVDGNLRLVTGMGWLRTEKEYQDFILEFEWRSPKPTYDSGIFLRVGLDGKPWPKDGWQINLSSDALGGLVQGYSPVLPAKTRRKPANQWVKFRIEVKGNAVSLDVDGERAWANDDVLDVDKGYLGFQAENYTFDFRNIRIQEL